MDLHEALLTRRTVHKYAPGAVPDGALRRALEAAHHAPAHKHTWPWRFTVLGPEARRRFVEVAAGAACGDEPVPEALRARLEDKFLTPGLLLIVSQLRSEDAFREEEDYAATCCAIQNFALAMHAEGFGTKWGTGKPTRLPGTYALAEIDPDAERIVGLLYAGVPAKVPETPRRPPLDGVLRRVG